jgi:hypothetical protein
MVQSEAKTIHPATKVMKDMVGTLTVSEACEQIMHGLQKRLAIIIPGKRAKMAYYSERYLPTSVLRYITTYLLSKR